MPIPFIAKLGRYVRLSDEDRAAITRCFRAVKTASARTDLISEGDRPTALNLILDGWACRYKALEDGRRQIVSFFLPGDLCDQHVYILRQMDHSIGTLSPVQYSQIDRAAFERLTENQPRITQALWWDTLVMAAIQREWTVNIGQRSASERIAHLFCELFHRLRVVGMTKGNVFAVPFTQVELAEATGMTPVHVNRSVQDLRARGLLIWKGRAVEIPDLAVLEREALFNSDYLHFDYEGRHLDANQ